MYLSAFALVVTLLVLAVALVTAFARCKRSARLLTGATRAAALTLESVTELASDAIVVMNDRGEIVSWNTAATRMFGRQADDVLGTTIWHMMPASAHDMYVQAFEGIVRGEIELPKTPVEITSARSDGSEFPSEVSTSRFVDGSEIFVVVIFRDISLRKRTDAALRRSTELAEGVLNSATEYSIIATDPDGVITVFNRGAERMLGYEAAQVIGIESALLPHDPDELVARLLELELVDGRDVLFAAAREGEAETHEWTYVRKDQSRLPVVVTVNAMFATDGKLRGFICIAHDLSAQRRAERRLALSNEAFRKAFDSAPVAVVLTKNDMTCAHANPAFCAMTGFDARALRKMSMLDLMVTTDDDERETQVHEYDPLVDGHALAHHCERRVRRADGSSLWAMVHTSVVNGEDGEPLLWVSHLEDVTERKAFEAASREAYARKTEALDRLAELDRSKSDFVSMVSHELRTPVTSILGYLELLEDGDFGELEPRQRDALLVVQQSASRLEHLIADLMSLRQFETHAPIPQFEDHVDIGELVRSVTTTMVPIIARRHHNLVLDIDEHAGVVLGDERQLEHVVSNLLTNALKFTPDQGEIVVRVRCRDGEVLISVRDTGVGIPAQDLSKVFKRFYRGGSDDVAKVPGTGLGLSIVKGIVKQHDGRVSLESQVGVGTTVSVVLPRLELEAAAVAARWEAS
jgi:PAS domain S-box-containing protein